MSERIKNAVAWIALAVAVDAFLALLITSILLAVARGK